MAKYLRYSAAKIRQGATTFRGPVDLFIFMAGLFGSQVPLQDGTTVTADEDYLRRHIEILMAYAAALEDDVAARAAAASELETTRAEHEEEIHRLHHEAAALQSRVAELQSQAADRQARLEELDAELTVFAQRGRYRLIDKAYGIATSVPGFQRSLQWADARHRARTQRRAGD